MSDKDAYLYKDSDCDGDKKKFTAPTSIPKLSIYTYDGTDSFISNLDGVDDSVSGVSTSSLCWMILYENENYGGRSIKITNNVSKAKIENPSVRTEIVLMT